MAPPGDLTIMSDAVIEDSALPDPIELDAGESPIEQLPNETLAFLLGSRYCETDKLADIAWCHFGSSPRGWRRWTIMPGSKPFSMDTGSLSTHATIRRASAALLSPAGAMRRISRSLRPLALTY
jgi:hypothetical protein